MTLDDIEQRARLVVNKDERVDVDAKGMRALVLARAVLVLLPVVRAAEAWNDDPDGRLKTDTDVELQEALEEMWVALGEEQ